MHTKNLVIHTLGGSLITAQHLKGVDLAAYATVDHVGGSYRDDGCCVDEPDELEAWEADLDIVASPSDGAGDDRPCSDVALVAGEFGVSGGEGRSLDDAAECGRMVGDASGEVHGL